jgi:hypothetical protein
LRRRSTTSRSSSRTRVRSSQFLTTTPGLVTTPDGHFKIAKQGNNFKFTAPRAKGVGQKYWGNTAILDAAGQDFVTKGDYMTLVTSADTGREVIKAALLQGWTLQTNTHKERAREITGTKQKGGATAAPTGSALRAASARRAAPLQSHGAISCAELRTKYEGSSAASPTRQNGTTAGSAA